MISEKMRASINAQVVNELHSSTAYLSVASWLEGQGWKILGAHFFKQSQEERAHALKFIRYLLEVGAPVEIGPIPAVVNTFESVEAAVEASLAQEAEVTRQINALMGLAHDERDFATVSFLKWFVDEQVEEMSSMSELLQLIRHAGKDRLILVEDRLMRQPVGDGGTGPGE